MRSPCSDWFEYRPSISTTLSKSQRSPCSCVLKGSGADVEDRHHEPCRASDGGRPSGVAVQAEIPNHRSVMPVKSRGGKRLRKRLAESGSGM
jgi:hypothetical protein